MTHRGWFFGLPEAVRGVVWKKVRWLQAGEAVSAMLVRRKSAVHDNSMYGYLNVAACFLIAPQKVLSLTLTWCLVTDQMLETVSCTELLDRVKVRLSYVTEMERVYANLDTVQRVYRGRVSKPERRVYGEFGDADILTFSHLHLTRQHSRLLL